MPNPPSGVTIMYNGTNITTDVIYSTASFESQVNAVAGTCEFTVRDLNHTHSFVTGKEVTLDIDGIRMFGGFVTQVTRQFALPADDTVDQTPSQVKSREWVLRGVDYNVLFDKVVLHHPGSETTLLPLVAAATSDVTWLRTMLDNYLDLPSGLDTTTGIEAVASPNPQAVGSYKDLGSTWRDNMTLISMNTGAIYYIDPDYVLRYRGVENSLAAFGFSDVPRAPYTIGFRELDATEDGSAIVDDAFVWGGSGFTAVPDVKFARAENATAISQYGRWQYADPLHFGEPNFASQAEVTARANVIVSGNPNSAGSTLDTQDRGLVHTQWTISLTWFGENVPTPGVHLRPGDLTTLIFYVLGVNGQPLVLELPLRQQTITFPARPENPNESWVQFQGLFGLQASDPWSLWRYLLTHKPSPQQVAIATANSTTTTPVFGAVGQFAPSPAADGTTKTFTTPLAYIAGSLQVYVNGLLVSPPFVAETDPAAGSFTFATAPPNGSVLWCWCLTTGA